MQDTPNSESDKVSRLLLSRREVARVVRLSPSTIDELERRQRFPKRIVVSSRCVRWQREQVEDWTRIGPDGWQERMAQVRCAL